MALPPDYRNEESLWWCLTHDKGCAWEWERDDLVPEGKSAHPESDEKAGHKAQRRREFLLGFLVFILGLYGVWTNWHALALWSLVTFVTIQSAFSSWSVKTRVLVVIAAVVAGAIIQSEMPATPRPETDTHGWLIPANDPTPPNACGTIPSDALVVIAGSNAVWTQRSELIAFLFGHCGGPHIEWKSNGLRVTQDVFAENGKLVARIENDEFHLVSREISYAQRSDDRSELSVFDPEGNQAFHIRFVNPHAVQITGVFFCDGSKLLINDSQLITPIGIHNSNACFGGSPAIGFIVAP
jgi:hypothetical protein